MTEQNYSKRRARKPHSEETKRKIAISHTGKKREPFSKEWREKMGSKKEKHPLWGKHHSEETRNKIRVAQLGEKGNQYGKYGENSANYKGGIYPLHRSIRTSFKNRQWRSDVFSRDDFTCQLCYIRGGNLQAHHLKQFSVILKENNISTIAEAILCEELWDINNGQTLCIDCHKTTDNYKGKKI
jgi:hypothetical protein